MHCNLLVLLFRTAPALLWAGFFGHTLFCGAFPGWFLSTVFLRLVGHRFVQTQYRGGVQGIMFFLVCGALGIWSLVGVGAIMGDISANPAGFFPAAVIMCVVLLISLVIRCYLVS